MVDVVFCLVLTKNKAPVKTNIFKLKKKEKKKELAFSIGSNRCAKENKSYTQEERFKNY